LQPEIQSSGKSNLEKMRNFFSQNFEIKRTNTNITNGNIIVKVKFLVSVNWKYL